VTMWMARTRKVIVVPRSVSGWLTSGMFAFLGSLLAGGNDIVMLGG
jgi:hypothetical protein